MGEKGAASLLRTYGSLENAITAGRLAAQAEKLRPYRSIATMDKSAPLPALRNQKPTCAKAAHLARDWQLNKLADRLDSLAQAQAWLDSQSGEAVLDPQLPAPDPDRRKFSFCAKPLLEGGNVMGGYFTRALRQKAQKHRIDRAFR